MFLFFALALVTAPPDWVPMRWTSADPKSLELLAGTPINCVLLERRTWSPSMIDAAASNGIATLGIIRPGDPADVPRGLNGVVFEGDWVGATPTIEAATKIELLPRSRLRFDRNAPVIGTYQAVWPGIQIEPGGSAKSAPSGGPWIDTNTGFLRFARAATTAAIWIANTPPPKTVITTERYLQAVSDAAMMGARWVIALDEDFSARLLKRDAESLKSWKRIADHVAWYESHNEWRAYQPVGQLAIVQDVDSGALYSGGVLDMISVKHTPVIAVPDGKLADATLSATKMAVNVDPASLTPEQKEVLRRFTRSGGKLLNGPPDWKFPPLTAAKITLGADDVKKLDEIWKQLNEMTGRSNLGARLFNVSSMLSNLLRSPDGKQTILHLVNYSDYPAENVTVHLLGRYKSAQLIAPGATPKQLEMYAIDEGAGTGVDIERMGVAGTLLLEPDGGGEAGPVRR